MRHVGFRLEGLEKSLQSSPGNMWHYLNAIMFDPLIPFRLIDLRDTSIDKHRNELIAGSRTRLASSAPSEFEQDTDETRPQVRYYRDIEYVSAVDGEPPTVAIEYWVVFARRKKKDGLALRSASNELFVQSNYPIVSHGRSRRCDKRSQICATAVILNHARGLERWPRSNAYS